MSGIILNRPPRSQRQVRKSKKQKKSGKARSFRYYPVWAWVMGISILVFGIVTFPLIFTPIPCLGTNLNAPSYNPELCSYAELSSTPLLVTSPTGRQFTVFTDTQGRASYTVIGTKHEMHIDDKGQFAYFLAGTNAELFTGSFEPENSVRVFTPDGKFLGGFIDELYFQHDLFSNRWLLRYNDHWTIGPA